MGYYTKFELIEFYSHKSENYPYSSNQLEEIISDEAGYEENGLWEESRKWYEAQSDLARVSSLYPHCYFVVDCEGEESGDLYRYHCFNGKCLTIEPEIIWPEPDMSLFEN